MITMGEIYGEITALGLLVCALITVFWGISLIAAEVRDAVPTRGRLRAAIPRLTLGWTLGIFLIMSDGLIYLILAVSTIEDGEDGEFWAMVIMLDSAFWAYLGYLVWADGRSRRPPPPPPPEQEGSR
jgi:hypothetical protein